MGRCKICNGEEVFSSNYCIKCICVVCIKNKNDDRIRRVCKKCVCENCHNFSRMTNSRYCHKCICDSEDCNNANNNNGRMCKSCECQSCEFNQREKLSIYCETCKKKKICDCSATNKKYCTLFPQNWCGKCKFIMSKYWMQNYNNENHFALNNNIVFVTSLLKANVAYIDVCVDDIEYDLLSYGS